MTTQRAALAAAVAWATLAAAIGAQSTAESSVWNGVYTEEQATRGEAAYLESCGGCHGAQLEGADMTPPLVGGVFGSNWNDLTVGDLFERIRITMPLDRPGKLTRQQTADVIALMLKANAWPSGQAELPTETAPLKQIKISSSKP